MVNPIMPPQGDVPWSRALALDMVVGWSVVAVMVALLLVGVWRSGRAAAKAGWRGGVTLVAGLWLVGGLAALTSICTLLLSVFPIFDTSLSEEWRAELGGLMIATGVLVGLYTAFGMVSLLLISYRQQKQKMAPPAEVGDGSGVENDGEQRPEPASGPPSTTASTDAG